MVVQRFCLVALLLLAAGCGGKPNLPAPVANPVVAVAPPPKPVEDEGPPLPLAGPPEPIAVKALQPVTPATNQAFAEEKIELDPQASFDDLSARFATARQEMKQLPIGEFELQELYNAAIRTPFRDKKAVEERVPILQEWATTKPEDPTPLIILARLYTTWGWEARGNGFINTVTGDGYLQFKDRLGEGLKYALAAEKLQPQDPELYRALVDLGKGLSAERKHIDRYVETGRKICPNYFPLYESTVEYLLPRWHGAPGDCEAFAESICAAVGGDDGLEAYARIAMTTNCYDRDMLYTSEYDPKKIAAGCEIMGKRFPLARAPISFAAVVAWMAQNHELARSYYPQLKGRKPEIRHWKTQWRFEQYTHYCEAPPCPDVADEIHWPFRQGTGDIAYLDGGATLVVSPQAKEELVRLWDRQNLKTPKGAIPPFPDKVQQLQAAGKQLLLTAINGKESNTVAIHLDTPEEPAIFKATAQHAAVILSPDGNTAATRREADIALWDPRSGNVLHEIPAAPDYTKLAFSPDSKRLLVATSKAVKLYDVVDAKVVAEIEPSKRLTGMYLSQFSDFFDSDTIFFRGTSTGGKTSFAKWLTTEQKGEPFLLIPSKHHMSVKTVSKNFLILEETRHPASTLLHVHRLPDGKYLRTIDGHYGPMTKVLIAPNESEFAVAELFGPIRFWKLPAAAAN
ncbi:WD40 repeat domain-containing protein [Anatilimnocola floriformis]|uniref:WD40 repeat domain-containing protein n=1 Tax=Anatilimnocola floriformis TaxID=2948575 RepID=UPI0020C2B97C|nr:WD40 repeat domain-containing protein [Anatilimnocola floriformis]